MSSVADPGCLSRIPDPDFYPSHIPDPGSQIRDPGSKNSNKRERWKKISCHTFLCSHKFNKIVNYFSFEVLKKKIWANLQRIIELFTKKIVKKLLNIWSWDPGSGIRKKPIPDPGSKGQKGTGSRIPDPDPQHCMWGKSDRFCTKICDWESQFFKEEGQQGFSPLVFTSNSFRSSFQDKRGHTWEKPFVPLIWEDLIWIDNIYLQV